MGALIGVAGTLTLLAGLISLLYPLRFLKITTRKQAGIVAAAGLVAVIVGAALTPADTTTGPTAKTAATAAEDTTGATDTTVPMATTLSTTTTSTPTTTAMATALPPTAAETDSTTTTIIGTPEPAAPLPTTPLPTTPPPPGAVSATVVSVTDGDTIRVSLGGTTEKLRLIGINTPESGECYADEATARMVELVDGKTAQLASDVSDRDQYGRLLRYVWVDGLFVNEVMVREGFGIARRYEPDTAMADILDAAQAAALTEQVGLWASDACGPATSAELRIEDVVYDAPGDDSQNLNGEWVVIANAGVSTVDLSGWVLKDESASHRYHFPTGFALLAGETVTVYSGCGQDSSTKLYWCVSGSAIWNNSGDTAFLLDPSGNITDTWAYGGSATTSTTSTTAPATTTTTAATTTTTVATSGAVTIATIHYDACGNDVECYNDSEYVELANSATVDIDLSGWSVTDAKDHTIRIPSGYRILAGGRFRIYAGSGDNDPTSRYFDGQDQAIWNNSGGDTATLRDSAGNPVDQYSY